MSKPSSFATICTNLCSTELIGLLLSLSIFHTNEKIYILCDSSTKRTIDSVTPKIKLEIVWFVELDKYENQDRVTMVNNGTWGDFQMNKALIIEKALQNERDTLYLDSDIIITDLINDIDKTKSLGVSPHYMRKDITDTYGYYNGGMLWANNKNISSDWILFTKNSRYYDQASIEDLTKKYDYFEFTDNYNLQSHRFSHNIYNDENKFLSLIKVNENENKIYYNDKPLKFIHSHFNTKTDKFNKIMIDFLKKAKMYKILTIIYRVINNKWIVKIPKQPIHDANYPTNDSYKELLVLKENSIDIDIYYDDNKSLEENTCVYDTTIEYCDEINNASLLLLFNV